MSALSSLSLRIIAALVALWSCLPAAVAVEKTSATSVDAPDVGAARASYEINRSAAQTTFLDRQITGLGFSPNGYSSTKVQRGITLDLYYTLVAGSLVGSRVGFGSEFADPILSQIASIQGKWVVLREGFLWPAIAGGVDLNLDLNFRGGVPFSNFRTLTYPSFVAFSKTVFPRSGTFITVGRYARSQMEHLAYLTRFLDHKASSVTFAGLDFKVKDPSKGFRVEVFLPVDHKDNAQIANMYIKALSAMPLTLITYARSDVGRAVVLSFSFRLTLFPSLTKEQRFKKKWWNPLSWYLNDNKDAAKKFALEGDGLLQKGEYKKAQKKYQESLLLNDKIAAVHYNLATASLQMNSPAELPRAIFHFNRSIELGGADAEKLYGLGLAYFKAGSKDNARKVWTDSLKFDPNYGAAKNAIQILNGPKG
ncbi:hypothetical protein HY522_05965 [bacterium]|nr:hypothetical protein [bacterium]